MDEIEASRASRRRAWENLQKIRWVIKDTTGVELPVPARKTIDLEGRLVKDGVRKALRDRQLALAELVHAIREYRNIAESKPLTLQGSDYAHSVHELNKAIDRAEAFLFYVNGGFSPRVFPDFNPFGVSFTGKEINFQVSEVLLKFLFEVQQRSIFSTHIFKIGHLASEIERPPLDPTGAVLGRRTNTTGSQTAPRTRTASPARPSDSSVSH